MLLIYHAVKATESPADLSMPGTARRRSRSFHSHSEHIQAAQWGLPVLAALPGGAIIVHVHNLVLKVCALWQFQVQRPDMAICPGHVWSGCDVPCAKILAAAHNL